MLEWIEHDGSYVSVTVLPDESLVISHKDGRQYFWDTFRKTDWTCVEAYRIVKVSDILQPYVKKRWRAKWGEVYWYVTDEGTVWRSNDTSRPLDCGRYNSGNYFRSIDEAMASKIYQAFERNQE